MPDLQTEMQKLLQSWDQPETTPKETTMFTPSNNVSKETFNYIRDNVGCTRKACVNKLVSQGHKQSSVTSLIGQMLRQGLIWQGTDKALYTNATEYAPLKSARTLANRAKKKTEKAEKTYKVITSKKESNGIAALVKEYEEPKPRDEVQHILDTISLPNAKRLHRALNEYFGFV